MEKVKVAFLGNSEISVYALKSLAKNEQISVELVISGKDKKIGRNQNNLQSNPVVSFAKEANLKLFQTDNINTDFESFNSIKVDYIITCSFGQFLSDKVLNWPLVKSINIHTSLLPKGRGGAPIHWSIIKGESKTGYSIMEMVSKMDAGDVYVQKELDINKEDTYQSLYLKLSNLIEQNFVSDFFEFVIKNPNPIKQDENKVSLWLNINKEDRYIKWNDTKENIDLLVRGLYDKPIALTIYNDLEIKITKVNYDLKPFPLVRMMFRPGQIVALNEQGIIVQTQNGFIAIEEFIIPGKKNISYKNFANGNPDFFQIKNFFRNELSK